MSNLRIERCLSVRQPWAWAICVGEKTVENRTWSTDYRGTIAIHASSSKQDVNALPCGSKDADVGAKVFTYGAIIGVADLVGCGPLTEELWKNPWADGPYCWKLENARRIRRPIAMKGKLNLFRLDESIIKRLEHQLQQPEPELDGKLRQRVLEAILPK